jgi:hypothetical protein
MNAQPLINSCLPITAHDLGLIDFFQVYPQLVPAKKVKKIQKYI